MDRMKMQIMCKFNEKFGYAEELQMMYYFCVFWIKLHEVAKYM